MAELAIKAAAAPTCSRRTRNQLIPIYGTLGGLLSDSLPTYEMRWTVTARRTACSSPAGR